MFNFGAERCVFFTGEYGSFEMCCFAHCQSPVCLLFGETQAKGLKRQCQGDLLTMLCAKAILLFWLFPLVLWPLVPFICLFLFRFLRGGATWGAPAEFQVHCRTIL